MLSSQPESFSIVLVVALMCIDGHNSSDPREVAVDYTQRGKNMKRKVGKTLKRSLIVSRTLRNTKADEIKT